MQQIHSSLMQSVAWYRNWHNKPNYNQTHLAILFLAIVIGAGINFPVAQEIARINLSEQEMQELLERNLDATVIRSEEDVETGVSSEERIIVKFKNNVSTTRKNSVLRGEGLVEKSEIPRINAKIIEIDEASEPQEVIDELKEEYGDLIEYAEVDVLMPPTFTPNDPNFPNQWPHTKIGSRVAWDSVTADNMDDITIAIVDSGVNCNHVDLAASCVTGWNTYNNNSTTTDITGHGTKVAGAAAGIGNNALGIAGTAYKAKIMPMRAVIDSGDMLGSMWISDAAEATVWAADRGAKVVNISYLLSIFPTIINAANYLESKGGVMVISSGNTSGFRSGEDRPNMIAVAGTTSSDTKYSWSTYGNYVDVAAPGCVGSTTLRTGGYGDGCGTSYSSPITAGAIAVIMAARPGMTGVEARDILYATARDLGTPGRDQYFGHGRIDLAAAVAAALGGQLPPPPPADTTAPTAPTNLAGTATATQVALTWSASTDAVGVTGYKVYRNGALYQTVTTNSYTDTAVTAGTTYTYAVSAHDAAGNNSAQTTPISRTIPVSADTTAPTVPTLSGTTTTTQVALSWTASTDNVGVTGYKLYRNGSLYQTLGSATSYIDNNVTAGTTYTYTVSAHDAAGNNSAQSSGTSVTIPVADTPPPQVSQDPVAHFKLDETSGTTVADSSSGGRTATASMSLSTASATGVVGKAVSFNGTNNFIATNTASTVVNPDSSDLTISAWVNIADFQYQNGTVSRRIVMQNINNSDGYMLSVSNSSKNPVLTFVVEKNGTLYQKSFTGMSLSANTWYKVDATWNHATNVSNIYINGAPQNIVSVSGFGMGTADNKLYIGKRSDNTGYFSGLIDDVKIYNRALSASEIANDYTTPPPPPVSDTTAPTVPTNLTGTATATQVALTWSASTDNVGVTGYKLYRNGSLYQTLGSATSYIDNNVTAGTTYTYTVSAHDAAGNNSAQSAPVSATIASVAESGYPATSTSPILHFTLDEASGTAITDSSENDFDAAASMDLSTASVSGKFGNAVNFNGTNNYIATNSSYQIVNPDSSDMTVAAWVNVSNFAFQGAYNRRILTQRINSGDGYALMASNATSNVPTISFVVFKNGKSYSKSLSGMSLSPNTWYRVVAVWKHATNSVEMYIDGTQKSVTSVSGLQLGSTNTKLFIGMRNDSRGYFAGMLDNIKIYNRALSASEVATDYTSQ